MAYYGLITKIENLRPHPNADRLQLGECFGNTVCVSLDYCEGQKGIYFPCDGQLSKEFAETNNLLRKKDAEGKNIGGYLDPVKRNVSAIKLRGEKSDGLFLPLSCLMYTEVNLCSLHEGDKIDVINGYEICQKYIPQTREKPKKVGNRTRKKKVNIAPLFKEHADTEQLQYNLDAFEPKDQIEITLKLHGSSGRTGLLPILKGYKKSLRDYLFGREGEPIYEYGYISGTRRTVLKNYEGGFYGSNKFREQHSKIFEGKLFKGETVYYEIVGFTENGTPIMPIGDNKKLQDKEFIKKYGNTTTFSYGCGPAGGASALPQSDIYVYRMTITNEDGEVIEYPPHLVRSRCQEMGIKTVPLFTQFFIPEGVDAGEYVQEVAEQFYEGTDPIGLTHIREGVVIRIVNRPKFCAFKLKNFDFKVLENIIKLNADAPDIEEMEELQKEV